MWGRGRLPVRGRMAIVFALVVFAGLVAPATALSAVTKEYGYVTTKLALPATNVQVNGYARDVDGDGDRDNNLGRFFATVESMGLDFQTELDASIERGDLLMLHSLRTPSLANTKNATWQVLYAETTENPDFSGFGSFLVANTAPRSLRLPATITDHRVKTAAGAIPLRLDLLGAIFDLPLKKGKIVATCARSSCTNGRITGAISAQNVHTFRVDLAAQFTPIVQRDCVQPGTPSGGCAADSTGKVLFNLFDENDDLQITEQELKVNSLVGQYLAPDLNLVKGDGDPTDALSFALAFETSRAGLVRP